MGHGNRQINNAGDVREVIREAREAAEDLRAAIREAEELKKSISDLLEVEANKHVQDALIPVIKDGMKRLNLSIEGAIAEADLRTKARFDQLTDIMLGEDKRHRRTDGTLADLIERKRNRESGS